MTTYFQYWARMIGCWGRGSPTYRGWVFILLAAVFNGAWAYGFQVERGLEATHLSEQVSWGSYYASFLFLAGVAAAGGLLAGAALLGRGDSKGARHEAALTIAISGTAALGALLFMLIDLGRPDQMLRLLPGLGLSTHTSLGWGVLVLEILALAGALIPAFLLYRAKARSGVIVPKWLVLMAAVLGIALAGLTGLAFGAAGARASWSMQATFVRHLLVLGAGGGGVVLLALEQIRLHTRLEVRARLVTFLARLVLVAVVLELGFWAFEMFSAVGDRGFGLRYVIAGFEGHRMAAPLAVSSVVLLVAATVFLAVPALRERASGTTVGASMAALGSWFQICAVSVIASFVPSPLGEIVEYRPSVIEALVSVGLWAVVALLFSLGVKGMVAVEAGALEAE